MMLSLLNPGVLNTSDRFGLFLILKVRDWPGPPKQVFPNMIGAISDYSDPYLLRGGRGGEGGGFVIRTLHYMSLLAEDGF